MKDNLQNFNIGKTNFCIELSEKRIFVSGNFFIKVFSLENYQEIKSFSTDSCNFEAEITSDQNFIFVATSKGLKQFYLPDVTLVKEYHHSSDGFCLKFLNLLNFVIFNNRNRLLSLDLNTSNIAEFKDHHFSFSSNLAIVRNIASTSDEQTIFSTGEERYLKKFDISSRSLIKCVDLNGVGIALVVNEESNSILVGLKNGVFSEFSIENLSLLRRVYSNCGFLNKILYLSTGNTVSCCYYGNITFNFTSREPIRISSKPIDSITELSDKSIACCCYNGLRIIRLPIDDECLRRLDSISSSLKSIRRSSSPREPQLIYLLQHHLFQLLNPIHFQPKKFTGLSISLLPDLKSLQRSYFYEGFPEGKKRLLTSEYSLEMLHSNSKIPDFRASLILFNQKVKLIGNFSNEDDPLMTFKASEVRKGKWIFKMNQEISIANSHLYGLATAHFHNGYLKCYISQGDFTTRSGFQTTVKVNGVKKKVRVIGSDWSVITSDGKIFVFDFERNRIEESSNI